MIAFAVVFIAGAFVGAGLVLFWIDPLVPPRF